MAIAPVSLVNLNPVSNGEKKEHVSNSLIFDQKPSETEQANDKGALKSYFMGGFAATVSFGGFPVSTGGFITKRMNDVPCSCCGGRMVRNPEMDNKAREFAGLNGEKLADKIEADKDFFRTPQRVVMMLAADEARKHPGYDLTRAKNACGSGLKEKTQNYCIQSLKSADALLKSVYGEENETSALLAKEMKKISEGEISRLHLTEELVKRQDSLRPDVYEQVLDAAMNIPVSFSEVRRAFGEANGSAQSIARSLLRPSMQTIEHIHPKSLGGPNATENFVAECADCNNPRGNMSYSQWLKIHPEFPLKAQNHIEWFQQQVVDGKIDSRYDDYGVDVKQTLSKESNGIIELKVLNPEKIQQLRDAKNSNQEVSVKEEIRKEETEEEK